MNRDTVIGIVGALLVVGALAGVFMLEIGGQMLVKGSHTGIVTATECGGLVWETCRAYVKTSGESSQEESYCVQSRDVLRDLERARESGRSVTVRYERERVFVPPWLCGGEYATIVKVSIK